VTGIKRPKKKIDAPNYTQVFYDWFPSLSMSAGVQKWMAASGF
jgi:hypothetical protein